MQPREYTRMFNLQSHYWWYKARRNFIATYLCSIKKLHKIKILDFGCGTGANLITLQQFGSVIGIDSSNYAKKYYTKLQQKHFVQADAARVPFASGLFDVVTFLDVLYHKNIHSPINVLKEGYRVLKPKGYCLVTDCAYSFLLGPHDKANFARERFTKNQLVFYMQQAGFTVLRSSYSFMLTFPLFFLLRCIEKLFNVSMANTIHSNNFLYLITKFESSLLQRYSLPFGSSIILLGQK